MQAIIKNGGKQYKVAEGDILYLDKMSKEPSEKIEFDSVLGVIGKDGFIAGTPFVKGATVEGEVLKEGKAKKVLIYKKRRRKDSKLKMGFRREYTQVKITKVAI